MHTSTTSKIANNNKEGKKQTDNQQNLAICM